MFKIALKVSAIAFASLLILVGLGFLVSSFYLYLTTVFPNHPIAALITGGIFILLAILILLIILVLKNRKSHLQQVKNEASGPNLLQKYPVQASILALGAGFLVGYSPAIRKILIDSAATYLEGSPLEDILKCVKPEEETD